MKEYVLVYATPLRGANSNSSFIAILKDRPDYQRGKWNLPGGKVEPGESPADAAIRELKEECGVDGSRPEIMGKVTDEQEYVIYVIKCFLEGVDLAALHPRIGETERPEWMSPERFLTVPTVSHIRTTTAICQFGLKDWTMTQVIGYHASNEQSFKLTFPKEEQANGQQEV